jgi:hypothetical protein
MTFDVDWLLDAAGQLSHINSVEDIDSSAFRSAWLSVARGVAQCGMPTLRLGPLIPEHLEGLSARKWVGEIHFLLLDCPGRHPEGAPRGAPSMEEPRYRSADQFRSLAPREY